MPLNEAFAKNMIGKTIKFDTQPYRRGTMKITKITERRVGPIEEFESRRGTIIVSYDVFDIEGTVLSGTEVAGLVCGVPISPPEPMDGNTCTLIGVDRGQLYSAVVEGTTIVQARCG